MDFFVWFSKQIPCVSSKLQSEKAKALVSYYIGYLEGQYNWYFEEAFSCDEKFLKRVKTENQLWIWVDRKFSKVEEDVVNSEIGKILEEEIFANLEESGQFQIYGYTLTEDDFVDIINEFNQVLNYGGYYDSFDNGVIYDIIMNIDNFVEWELNTDEDLEYDTVQNIFNYYKGILAKKGKNLIPFDESDEIYDERFVDRFEEKYESLSSMFYNQSDDLEDDLSDDNDEDMFGDPFEEDDEEEDEDEDDK
ncbi:MAG: hypothetical protein N2560_08310 [Ignavibacteria bacterium]|nr:hypothetical protein [Ignavibacteria bacterium]